MPCRGRVPLTEPVSAGVAPVAAGRLGMSRAVHPHLRAV